MMPQGISPNGANPFTISSGSQCADFGNAAHVRSYRGKITASMSLPDIAKDLRLLVDLCGKLYGAIGPEHPIRSAIIYTVAFAVFGFLVSQGSRLAYQRNLSHASSAATAQPTSPAQPHNKIESKGDKNTVVNENNGIITVNQ
jgi:hypothetical protein